ncbi:MAG: PAS domain-containing protein [Phycisphaerales bacterium]|nr:PAS domain-containing protein [Phycisphaerales bacterium]MCB9854810.1 PAS domain-containing protein [Phycisphaerales bacterium]MCB9863718.1 PAS domain-containing protein [Phycisphaerales bacterium]
MKANLQDNNKIDANLMVQALDGLCVGLVLMDAPGRVLWFNRAAGAAFGLSDPQSIGTPLQKAIRDPEMAAFWVDALERDETIMAGVSMRWPHPAELKVNCTRSLDEDGNVIARAVMFCDVTRERAVQMELTQEVAARLMDMAADHDGNSQPLPDLTSQELRVLRLVGQGLSNDAIADELSIAPSTIRSHLKQLYRKLNLHTRAEAVRYAVQNHLA